MPIHGIRSGITETALKRFIDQAKEGEELSCSRIKGFGVRKNRSAGSASYRFRPTSRHHSRKTITIAKVTEVKIQEAAQIALRIIDALNAGESPRGVVSQLVKGRLVKPEISKNELMLLGHFFSEVYEPLRRRESGDSATSSLNSIKAQWGHLFACQMSKLTIADVQKWQAEKTKQGLKYKTIKKYYACLRALLNTAVKMSHQIGGNCEGILDELPFKVNPLLKPTKEQIERENGDEQDMMLEKRRILEDWELDRLQTALYDYGKDVVEQRERSLRHSNRRYLPSLQGLIFPHWIIPFAYICYYTGMRPGDVLTLKWEDVQEDRIIKVTNKSKGKLNQIKVNIPITATKSVMWYSLKDVLEHWHEQMGRPTKGYLFEQSRKPGAPISEKGYKKSWDNIKAMSGVEIDMYAFRHHFISTLIRKGVNIKLIASLVGHTTTQMIEQNYAHHLPSDMEEAMANM